MCNASLGDLIETLWNVKIDSTDITADGVVGFNRDIVECKVKMNIVVKWNGWMI